MLARATLKHVGEHDGSTNCMTDDEIQYNTLLVHMLVVLMITFDYQVLILKLCILLYCIVG